LGWPVTAGIGGQLAADWVASYERKDRPVGLEYAEFTHTL